MGKGQYKVTVKIEGEKPIYIIYIIPAKHSYPMSKFSYNGSNRRYAEYEVVPVKGILLQKYVFRDLGKRTI